MEQYWRIGPYLVEDTTLEEVAKGVFLPFVHRPLSRYVNAMAADGLLITHMEEPAPPPGSWPGPTSTPSAVTIPRLLFLRAGEAGHVTVRCHRPMRNEPMAEFLIVTGLSGAGRSTAATPWRTSGWFVVDNMPAGDDLRGGRAGAEAGVGDRPGGPGRRADRAASPTSWPRRWTGCATRAPGSGSCSSTPPTRCWSGGSRAPASATPWPAR